MNARLLAVAATVAFEGTVYRRPIGILIEEGVRLGRLKLYLGARPTGEPFARIYFDRPAGFDPEMCEVERLPSDTPAARLMQARFPTHRLAPLTPRGLKQEHHD